MLVEHLLATAALRVRIQISHKNTKWASNAKEWPTHSSPPKNVKFFLFICLTFDYDVGSVVEPEPEPEP
jgi:hypothetical protein